MLSHVFLSADRDPDILIGAQLPELNAAYRVGKTGTDFIFEACEYRDSFLSFRPTIAVVLNVEMDHPDYFKDMEQVRASFHKYLQIPGKSGHAVINADDENAMQCAKGIETPVTTFSLSSPAADFYATNLHFVHGCGRCDVMAQRRALCPPLPFCTRAAQCGKRACGHCRCYVVRLRRRTNHPRVIYVYRGASTHGIQGDICANGRCHLRRFCAPSIGDQNNAGRCKTDGVSAGICGLSATHIFPHSCSSQ